MNSLAGWWTGWRVGGLLAGGRISVDWPASRWTGRRIGRLTGGLAYWSVGLPFRLPKFVTLNDKTRHLFSIAAASQPGGGGGLVVNR